jgi:hypothetical protein
MDELFRAYKGDCRINSQKVFAQKLKANAKAVAELKAEHAACRAAGETISSEELKKVNTVVTLQPEDVGKICFGELTEDGMPAADSSPFDKHLTKEKILRAAKKVCHLFVFVLCVTTAYLTVIFIAWFSSFPAKKSS